MKRSTARSSVALIGAASLVFAACGSDDDAEPAGTTADDSSETDATDATTDDTTDDEAGTGATTTEAPADDVELATIVVTTNILGDVVGEVVGDSADVVTIMPVGADPHDFQPSAQEIDTLMRADVVIHNGAAFEEGLLDVLESAEDDGIPMFAAISVVDTIEFDEGGHDHGDDDHGDDDHDHGDEDKDKDEEHDHEGDDHDHEGDDHDHDGEGEEKDADHDHEGDDHEGHDHSGEDPHFFTDPMRMAAAVEGIVDFLQAELELADPAALDESGDAYIAELVAVDGEIEAATALIPDDGRVLITNHEVFGYFADRYDFEVAGIVIPGGGTTGSVSPGELAELVEVIEDEGVDAIFSDTSASDELIQVLADEVGDIEVVPLYTESLGEPGSDGETYLGMVRANGERIGAALS